MKKDSNKQHLMISITIILFLIITISSTGIFLFHARPYESSIDPSEAENIPPSLVLSTIILGGFRGVLTDILWLRLSVLQDKGKYLELLQLADWITILQPRNIEIWQFHAWNLAYNISVMIPDAAERWRWVRSGIELLQNHGLLYNPESAGICHSIGWMYQHKIGTPMDACHLYYKKLLASDMSKITDQDGHINYLILTNQIAKGNNEFIQIIERYNLKPHIMKKMEEEFHALDWRLPETHAIYWAWRGLITAKDNDLITCHRMILQCLSEIFRSGKLIFDADANKYERKPDIDRINIALKQYEKIIQKYPLEGMFAGKRTLLTDASRIFYNAKRNQEAIQFFNQFNSMLPEKLRFTNFEHFISSPPGTYFVEPPGYNSENEN